MTQDRDISYFAQTNYRRKVTFGIRQRDRLAHMYVIGKTGVGKSTMLETLIRQDLEASRGVAVFDPHGDLVERVARDALTRRDDVTYFNAPDPKGALGFNPLEQVGPAHRSLAAAGLLDAFRKIWWDSWGPRLEHILRNALFALLEIPGATLGDILRLLGDQAYRTQVVARLSNPQARYFWSVEFPGYPARLRADAIAPLQNKVGAFLTDPALRRILSAPQSAFRLRAIMDEGQVFLVNLSKGRIGEDTATLLGGLLLSRLNLAALSRASAPETERRPFYCYLDEFQSFATLTFLTMLSELRKYGAGFVMAHQYLAQLDPAVRDAVLGNAGTLIVFRVGAADAETLVREFYPPFTIQDIVNLPNRHIYLKLMIDGAVSQPFSAETLGARILEYPSC